MGFNSGFEGLIYYSKSALQVSGNVIALHQEHLTVFTVSGCVYPSSCRLAAGSNLGEYYQIMQIQSSAPDDGRKHRPKHVELIPLLILSWYTILYKLHKIKFLYMFRASSAHLHEFNYVNCTCMQPLVFSFSAGGRLVHSPLSKCTWRPPAENENTRGCIHVQLTSLTSWRWADDAQNM